MKIVEMKRKQVFNLASTDLGVKTHKKEIEVFMPKKKRSMKERLIRFFFKEV